MRFVSLLMTERNDVDEDDDDDDAVDVDDDDVCSMAMPWSWLRAVCSWFVSQTTTTFQVSSFFVQEIAP